MTWAVWCDAVRDAHVVAVVDVPPMAAEWAVSPWHVVGDTCPCQPRVIQVDNVTAHRIIGHQDPVQ